MTDADIESVTKNIGEQLRKARDAGKKIVVESRKGVRTVPSRDGVWEEHEFDGSFLPFDSRACR